MFFLSDEVKQIFSVIAFLLILAGCIFAFIGCFKTIDYSIVGVVLSMVGLLFDDWALS